MKQNKVSVYNIVVALFFIAVFSATLQVVYGIPVAFSILILGFLSFAPVGKLANGNAYEMIYKAAYVQEMKVFVSGAENDTFLDGIADYSMFVGDVGKEAQAINLVHMGVLPDVLINNTTYPIPTQDLPVGNTLIELDKYQTKRYPLSDDVLYAAIAEKRAAAIRLHGASISIWRLRKALHAFGPPSNSTDMPVLVTTGSDDGTGRKRLLWEDILRLKVACDNLEIPEEVRRLTFCTDHMNDLCLTDQKFKDQYYNRATGKVYSQLSFDIREHLSTPYYNPSTKAKLAFGSIPTAGTHQKASIFFRTDMAAKATGWTKMYGDPADTANQTAFLNFRHYFIALPTQQQGRAAIVSGNVS